MTTLNGRLNQISSQACPEHVEIGLDHKMFVSYQCGGPTGRSGHDAVEVYDYATQNLIGTFSGPPMVGNGMALSIDGATLALDGGDACRSPQYDHEGCGTTPSDVIHFVRISDLQILKSLFPPIDTGNGAFLDVTHLVVFGRTIEIMDTSKYTMVEAWEGGTMGFPFVRAFAFDRASGRAYVAPRDHNELIILEAEPAFCQPPERGLNNYYGGDGVATDLEREDNLTPHGTVIYAPGRVGQAFKLDGKTAYLTGPFTQHNKFGVGDSSFVAYVKFNDRDRDAVIFDHRGPDIRLARTPDNRIGLRYHTVSETVEIATKDHVVPDRWYQIAAIKTNKEVYLYLDGSLQSTGLLSSRSDGLEDETSSAELTLGASCDHSHFLAGKLDEVLVYGRALDAREVKIIYDLREIGSCKV